ncbi:hypothetical protein [Absicoccus intestinalis]|uniref:Rod shape-determining protein MreD n=1 Tax=Absicoccus intestinalis TaxID=2926319 RepID=A0ABU4WJZ0_9FIRM|nr:hypothetical protein [Absicoccus sp. CLA-KB-P134]MDX8416881.1 hypothetical protein [Absicoccus sp. CLA-KB-P134]
MKLRTFFLFLLIMALLDTLIVYIWPPDFSFQNMSFVPHICFMALLLLVYKRNWIDRVLMGMLCGLIYDYFFLSTFPLSTILFPAASFGLGWLIEKTSDDVRWLSLGTIGCVILLDILPFLVSKLFGQVSVSFGRWFLHMELMTIVFHCAALLALYYIIDVIDRISMRHSNQKNAIEKKNYRRIRSFGK